MRSAGWAIGVLLACGCGASSRSDGGPDVDHVFDSGPIDVGNSDGGLVQLNDVSILFPLPEAADFPDALLAASTVGVGGAPLLPEAIYSRIGPISGSTGQTNGDSGSSGISAYRDLRVVAIRLDPCFAALQPDPHGAGCLNQLRLVFQEVRPGLDGHSQGFDSALHVFYRVSRDELVELAAAFGRLRAESRGGERLGPLQPHPVMRAQGPGGLMSRGVRALIVAHAGSQNITRITVLSAVSAGFQWTFSGFDFDQSQHETRMVIASLNTNFQTLSTGLANDLSGNFSPTTSSADDFTALASITRAAQLTAAQRQAAYDALLRIENPTRHSPETIDCAQCHLATPTDVLVARAKYSMSPVGNQNAFAADGAFVLPGEMAATFSADGQTTNVHAFSYFFNQPGINQRTVNESAAVAAYLNALR